MTNPAATSQRQQRGRPFPKGQSGNPAGRRPGTRCRATEAAEALLAGEAEALTRKAVELALGGDVTALRLCVERIIPIRRGRLVAIDLPAITGAGDMPSAFGAITAAVAGAIITPEEGAALGGLVENHRRAIETAELIGRLEAVEERLAHED